jgi:hypothetical protein
MHEAEAMPKLYFDFRDGAGNVVPDNEGLFFADLDAAKIEASMALVAHGAEVLPGTQANEIAVQVRQDSTIIFEIVLAIEFVDWEHRHLSEPRSTA